MSTLTNDLYIYSDGVLQDEKESISAVFDLDLDIDSYLVVDFQNFKELVHSVFIDYGLEFEYKLILSLCQPSTDMFMNYKPDIRMLLGKPNECFKNISPETTHLFFNVMKYDTKWKFSNLNTKDSVSLDNLDLYPTIDLNRFERLVNWIRYQTNLK